MPIVTNRLRPARFEMPIDGELDYGIDLGSAGSSYLEDGEVIASATWSVPHGLTVPEQPPTGGPNPAISGSRLIIWLRADIAGEYDIVANFVTSAGRKDSAWFRLQVFDPSTR